MKNYIGYEELEPKRGFPCMKDCMEKEPYPHKEAIVQYLRNGNTILARVSRTKDVFSGEYIPFEVLGMTDGKYFWANILAWYVDKYNVRLPKEFEAHILNQTK